MTIFDMPNYLWINPSNDGINCLLYIGTEKMVFSSSNYLRCFSSISFLYSNFYNITFQPLLGYAAFLAIISLMISFLLWYFTRGWRRERKEKQLEKR